MAASASRASPQFIPHLHAFRGFAILNIVAAHSWGLLYYLSDGPTGPVGVRVVRLLSKVLFHDSTFEDKLPRVLGTLATYAFSTYFLHGIVVHATSGLFVLLGFVNPGGLLVGLFGLASMIVTIVVCVLISMELKALLGRHSRMLVGTNCGRICFKRRKINVSTIFAGQWVGVKQMTNSVWLVSFMQYDLGYFDAETVRLEPIENPFRSDVLPMCPV